MKAKKCRGFLPTCGALSLSRRRRRRKRRGSALSFSLSPWRSQSDSLLGAARSRPRVRCCPEGTPRVGSRPSRTAARSARPAQADTHLSWRRRSDDAVGVSRAHAKILQQHQFHAAPCVLSRPARELEDPRAGRRRAPARARRSIGGHTQASHSSLFCFFFLGEKKEARAHCVEKGGCLVSASAIDCLLRSAEGANCEQGTSTREGRGLVTRSQ